MSSSRVVDLVVAPNVWSVGICDLRCLERDVRSNVRDSLCDLRAWTVSILASKEGSGC